MDALARRRRRHRGIAAAALALAVAVTTVAPAAAAPREASGAAFSESGIGFAESVDQPAGDEPGAVALADLDGDSALDLVVVSSRNPDAADDLDQRGGVSVRRGDGRGGFGAARNHFAGQHPVAVSVADLNADARPDIAVANHSSHDVTVLLGDGRGGFGAPRDFRAGQLPGPTSIAIGEVTGDAAVDLVVGRERAGGLVVLPGDGAGSFGAPVLVAAVHVTAVEVADLDRDGRLDVVAAHAGDLQGTGDAGVVVLRGSSGGLGPPATYAAGLSPASLAVGDLDADGILDLAITSNDTSAVPIVGSVAVLLGDGNGGFAPQLRTSTGGGIPTAVRIADLDGDGRADLAVVSSPSPSGPAGSLLGLVGDGAGGFGRPVAFPVGAQPGALALGLVDGDSAPDAVVANREGDSVSFLRGAGGGNLIRNPSFETDTRGWGSFSGALTRVGAGRAPDGGFVARVQRTGGTSYSISDNHGGLPTAFTVRAGERYVAGCSLRAANAQSIGRPVRIVLRERVGVDGPFVRETVSTGTLGTAFSRMVVTAEAIGGADHTMGVRCEQSSAVAGDAFEADLMTLGRIGVVAGPTGTGSTWTAATVNTKRASAVTTLVPREVVSVRAYLDGRAGGTGSQPVTGILYAGTAAGPTTLVATTFQSRVVAGAPAGWVTLRFANPVRIPSGTYWIGLHTGGTASVIRFGSSPGPGALRVKNDAFADGATAVFGAATTDSKRLSAHLEGG